MHRIARCGICYWLLSNIEVNITGGKQNWYVEETIRFLKEVEHSQIIVNAAEYDSSHKKWW